MRSKIIFVVLFMLTFTIMHDSVINIIQKSNHSSLTHYVNSNVLSQECADIHESHSMFHFVALAIPYKSTFVQLQKEKTLSHNLLQYTLLQKETSYKPPIA